MPEEKAGIKGRIAEIEYEQIMFSRCTIAHQLYSGGLDGSLYLLMSRIDGQGPMSITELSHALRLDNSTLQRQMTAAIKGGYLERIADPQGNVARTICLTAMGAQRLSDSRALSTASLEQILGDWSCADIEQFAKYLNRFNSSIEEYSEAKRA
ncbi:MarR family winged helix-turn-helix transcriptional regulator [Glutamicibacter sp. FR1]|uniref:MarR family winged helix-turn-helix transcriptional regulator n=1 Tax=Glutamicibacter sp. FR1 TaxID=3393744 RepID=UPI0039B06B49